MKVIPTAIPTAIRCGLLLLLMLLNFNVWAEPVARQTIDDFMAAHTAVYQPDMGEAEMDRYLGFMADDITDFHAAYGVTLEGKTPYRNGLPSKARDNLSFTVDIHDVVLGENIAVIDFTEQVSESVDGETQSTQVRTILVLEFNEDGLISHMRRYLS